MNIETFEKGQLLLAEIKKLKEHLEMIEVVPNHRKPVKFCMVDCHAVTYDLWPEFMEHWKPEKFEDFRSQYVSRVKNGIKDLEKQFTEL